MDLEYKTIFILT